VPGSWPLIASSAAPRANRAASRSSASPGQQPLDEQQPGGDAHDGRHLAADNRADTHADRPPQRRNRTASHDEQARMIRRYIAWRVDAGTADSRRARTGEPARGDHVVDRDPRWPSCGTSTGSTTYTVSGRSSET
jgi:hypothetical protein